jgi:glycerol-3-phosphate dehydrogenase
MNRSENISKLKTEKFDLLVIGAGASGSGVALDASLRGLKVALIEKGDFSCQTSSRSTKLIHGGVRYLEQAFTKFQFSQLKQVKHGLQERKYLLANAGHLSKPLGIITPVFSTFEALYYTVGLKIYGFFAQKDHLPAARWLSKKEAKLLSPDLSDDIHSAVMYFDGQLDDARFALALAQTAHKSGAVVANYISWQKFIFDASGKISGIIAKDEDSGSEFTINSKVVINCTGPFADNLRLSANKEEEPRIVPSKGVHMVLSKDFFKGDKAMLIPKTKDGRLIFVIPFKKSILVGTTDTPYQDIDREPLLEKNEAEFLLETLKNYVRKVPEFKDIKAGFGGVRPLLAAKTDRKNNNTKSLLRDHEVEFDEKSGLLSLLGGKWTTYRLMAEDATDKVCEILGLDIVCKTHEYPLVGSENFEKLPKPVDVESDVFKHLQKTYGDRADKVLKIVSEDISFGQRIHPEKQAIKAEVIYSIRNEMLIKPRDFFAQRLRWEILDWKITLESVETVVGLMKQELKWTHEKSNSELSEYKILLQSFIKTIS